MKVDLKKSKDIATWIRTGTPHRSWSESFPFYFNPRGILVHRVKSVFTLWNPGQKHAGWEVIKFFCGNQVCGSEQNIIESPPEGCFICDRCERVAVKAKEVSSDVLAGRHVHTGKCKRATHHIPQQTCCEGRETDDD